MEGKENDISITSPQKSTLHLETGWRNHWIGLVLLSTDVCVSGDLGFKVTSTTVGVFCSYPNWGTKNSCSDSLGPSHFQGAKLSVLSFFPPHTPKWRLVLWAQKQHSLCCFPSDNYKWAARWRYQLDYTLNPCGANTKHEDTTRRRWPPPRAGWPCSQTASIWECTLGFASVAQCLTALTWSRLQGLEPLCDVGHVAFFLPLTSESCWDEYVN